MDICLKKLTFKHSFPLVRSMFSIKPNPTNPYGLRVLWYGEDPIFTGTDTECNQHITLLIRGSIPCPHGRLPEWQSVDHGFGGCHYWVTEWVNTCPDCVMGVV